MLTYFVIKPEAYHLTNLLKKALEEEIDSDPESSLNPARRLMVEGINVFEEKTDASLVNEDLLYVRKGEMSEGLLGKIYQKELETGTADHIREAFTGKPYGLVVMNVEGGTDDILREIRGKMYEEENMEGTGIRGSVRRKYQKLVSEKTSDETRDVQVPFGGNFIHMPDTEDEAWLVLNYLHSPEGKEENGKVLLDRETKIAIEPGRELNEEVRRI